jgi:hypothetical protein
MSSDKTVSRFRTWRFSGRLTRTCPALWAPVQQSVLFPSSPRHTPLRFCDCGTTARLRCVCRPRSGCYLHRVGIVARRATPPPRPRQAETQRRAVHAARTVFGPWMRVLWMGVAMCAARARFSCLVGRPSGSVLRMGVASRRRCPRGFFCLVGCRGMPAAHRRRARDGGGHRGPLNIRVSCSLVLPLVLLAWRRRQSSKRATT